MSEVMLRNCFQIAENLKSIREDRMKVNLYQVAIKIQLINQWFRTLEDIASYRGYKTNLIELITSSWTLLNVQNTYFNLTHGNDLDKLRHVLLLKPLGNLVNVWFLVWLILSNKIYCEQISIDNFFTSFCLLTLRKS